MSRGIFVERLARCVLVLSLLLFTAVTLYPFLYVVSMSVSDVIHVVAKDVYFLPKGFSFDGYEMLVQNKTLWTSYGNTIYYTLVGTAINIVLTVSLAYPLSRSHFFARNPIMMFITFTMFFSGGMVPMFILVNNLGIYNTRWALLLPGAINTFNCIVARTFFQSLPEELAESARLEGANDIRILISIMLPLSMPIIAVLALYYAVSHWNTYFNALLYLPNTKLQPLQVFLMRILIQYSDDLGADMQTGLDRVSIVEKMRYCVIIVSILPIICVYPFLQKYFVKGVMIGALKS